MTDLAQYSGQYWSENWHPSLEYYYCVKIAKHISTCRYCHGNHHKLQSIKIHAMFRDPLVTGPIECSTAVCL